MKIDKKIFLLKESATLKINLIAQEMRRKKKPVYHFGFGESPFPVPKIMHQALCDHAHEKSYLPGMGYPPLREKIAMFLKKQFGYDYPPESIVIGPGSKELLFDLLLLLEGTLLIPTPSWVSYEPIARIHGKGVKTIITDYHNHFKLTAGELEAAIQNSPAPHILILNSPSNPTGQVYTLQELSPLSDICRQYGVSVISDEIYALLDFTDPKRPGIGNCLPEQTIVTGGISKAFGAGGWRLGFAALPPREGLIEGGSRGDDPGTVSDASSAINAINAIRILISESFSCVSSPIQHACLSAFEMGEEIQSYLEKCRRILQAINHYTAERLQRIGVEVHPGEGGFYLFPNFDPFRPKIESLIDKDKGRGGGERVTSAAWCDYLLERGIAVLPGIDFGRPEDELTVRMATVNFEGASLLSRDPQKIQEDLIPEIAEGLHRLEEILLS